MKAARYFQERMKPHYYPETGYPETGSLCIELKSQPGEATREVTDALNADLDAAGVVVGFDIDHASKRFDLTTLETVSLPIRTTRAA